MVVKIIKNHLPSLLTIEYEEDTSGKEQNVNFFRRKTCGDNVDERRELFRPYLFKKICYSIIGNIHKEVIYQKNIISYYSMMCLVSILPESLLHMGTGRKITQVVQPYIFHCKLVPCHKVNIVLPQK